MNQFVFLLLCFLGANSALAQKTAEAYCDSGFQLFEEGKYDQSLVQFNYALQVDSNYAKAYFGIGGIHALQKHPGDAIQAYTKSIEINHKYAYAYVARGIEYLKLGQLQKARLDFDKAIEYEPNISQAYFQRAMLKGRENDFQASNQDLDSAIVYDPQNHEAYFIRGVHTIKEEKYYVAYQYFEKALEIEKNATYYNCRGYTNLKLGKYQDAIADWNTMLQFDHDHSLFDYIEEAKQKLAELAKPKLPPENSKCKFLWLQPSSLKVKSNDKTYSLKATIDAPGAKVTLYINGSPLKQARDFVIRVKSTTFSQEVNLNFGDNEIYLEATVDSQIVQSDKIIIRYEPASSVKPRLALVVGNGDYQKNSADLPNPVKDARMVSDVLAEMGFEVLFYENLSKNELDRAIIDFGKQLREKGREVGLFYYAGHGMQSAGKNYLIPVDAKLDEESEIKYECIEAGMALERMEDAKMAPGIVILDACRNNPFERSWRRSPNGKGLAFMTAADCFIAFATAPGEVANDQNSYTTELVRHLRTPGLDINEVFDRTMEGVKKQTNRQQIPFTVKSYGKKFYFKLN